MWSRKLEEKIEVIRKEMEQVAMDYGITHPDVYQLSLELDQLHNQWQKEHEQEKNEESYYIRHHPFHIKERSHSTVSMYQTICGA